MKLKTPVYTLIVFSAVLLLTYGCNKDDTTNDNNNPTAAVPVLTTDSVSNITLSTATCGGKITNDNGKAIIARGVCWSTGNLPTIADSKTSNGTGTSSFTSSITGLAAGTNYYVRAYATSSEGTGYGSAVSFKTLGSGTVSDIDGNIYHTVTIGTQVWMVENLKVTRLNDGTAIPLVTDTTAWSNLTTPGYCWYDNDEATYKATYGALYNWYAVNTGKLCPAGWHVATDAEWKTLTTFLGGDGVAGGKLKEAAYAHWNSPNKGATNSYSFTALPGGSRNFLGKYHFIGDYGYWWSPVENDSTTAWYRYITYGNTDVYSYNYNKAYGFSVRCLKD